MMIIGQGLLAKSFVFEFSERPDITIFASGVSNSQERDERAFARERILLERTLQDATKIVYFSSCSLYDPQLSNTPYVLHKQAMETLVKQALSHAIFRLPQVVGKTSNAKTLTNFICSQLQSGAHFEVWKYAQRNLIDVSDVALIVKFLLDSAQAEEKTINIACPASISIIELIGIFEDVLQKRGSYSLIEAGGAYSIDVDVSSLAAQQLGINFNDNYVERVIKKYYGE